MAHARARLGLIAALLTALIGCGGGSNSGSSTPPPPVATSLAFSVQPGPVVAGQVIAPAVEVSVLDGSGALFTSPVTVSLALAGGGALHGTVSAVATGGHATFADLSVHEAAAGYTLLATSAGLTSATSGAFGVTAAAPDAAASDFVAAPTSVTVGDVVALTATIRDGFGNAVPGAEVAFSATGSGNTFVQPTAATDPAGVATGTLASSQAEVKTLTATVSPGGAAVAVSDQPLVAFAAAAVSSVTVSSAGGATVISGIGGTLQLTAAVLPASAPQTVTWSTSSAGVATISQSGLVTSFGRGEVTLTATATDGSGVTGSLKIICADDDAIFVQQPRSTEGGQWATATFEPGGVMTLSARFGPSGNAFKYSNNTADGSYGYYGTNSNGFVCLPYTLTGDFTIQATLSMVSTPKASSTCGVGVGFTAGFQYTDPYAYTFLPTTAGTTTGVGRYVNGATSVGGMGVGSPGFQFSIPSGAVQVSASRSGPYLTFAFDSAGATNTANVSYFTDGTTVYGAGPVYPCLSFNNVVASVSALQIRNGAGDLLFDLATWTLSTYTPGSLSVASSAVVVNGQSTTVTATAVAAGGGTAAVTAVAADSTVVDVAVANGASSSTITLTGLRAGSTTVTVTNLADPVAATRTRTIQVLVEEFQASDPYGSLAGRVYPAAGATDAYADGELSITFDAAPVPTTLGSIDIYSYPGGALVDRIFFQGESQTVAGVSIVVGPQLARVDGNTLYFTPHFGKLAHGGSYYVGVSTTAVGGVLSSVPFTGLSNDPAVATWRFQVRPAPSLTATVSVNGSQAQSTADFRTLGGALMALAASPIPAATAVTVDVAAGTYTELVNYRAATPNPNLTITIRGPAGNVRGDTAVVQYVNGGNWNGAQNARASFYFAGANLVLENLTLRNNGTRSQVAQAEAMYFDSRAGFTMAAHNCSFISRQDTVNTTGRTWIYDSYIEGNTDFIWGIADVALIEGCSLRVVNDTPNQTYAMFVARTGTTGAATVGKGFVLLGSTVSVDAGIFAAYGRNAGGSGFYDQVALVNNTFTGGGALATGLWQTTTAPLSLGDASSVGWKAQGNTGLGADTAATAAGTSATVAALAAEYDTRHHILNRVVTVSGGVPTGFADAATTWDVSGLAAAWGAP